MTIHNCITPQKKTHAFKFKVYDNSMIDGQLQHQLFNIGNIVTFNIEVEPSNEDFVIAEVLGEEKPVLRQLIVNGSKSSLKPLNSGYPMVEGDFRLFGKVTHVGWLV